MSTFLQTFLFADTIAPFKPYEELQTAFYVSENFSYPKASFFAFYFLPDALYIDVEPKLMILEAVPRD